MRIRIQLIFLGIIAASIYAFAQAPKQVGRYAAVTENVSGAGDNISIQLLRWSTDAERDQLMGVWNTAAAPPPVRVGGAGAGAPGAGGGGRGGGGRGAPPAGAPAAGGAPAGDQPAPAAGGGGGGRGGRGGGAGAPPAAAAGDQPAPAAGGRGGGRGAPPAGAAAGDQPAGAAAGGAGGGRGGRGGGGAPPAAGDQPAAAAAGARGGAAAGGGRGGAAPAPEVPRETPENALGAAFEKAPTLGYIWTSESTGYAIRFAYRLPQPDGTERVLLATSPRLGTWSTAWKLTGNPAGMDYPFSLIELRLNARGEGEGRASLSGKVVMDPATKMIALENYSALPIILKTVKRQAQ